MSEAAPSPIVVVSPHFDDAVLSCWSVLEGGDDVLVLTVFTAGPPPGRLFEWDQDRGVSDSATAMVQRREENRAALEVAGCKSFELGLLEGGYGGGQVSSDALRPHLLDADVVYAPAGVGRVYANPDHGRVRDAVLEVREDAHVYADQPYCGFKPDFALPADLAIGLVAHPVSLSYEQRARKAEAIRCYGGELPKLESGIGDWLGFGPFAAPEHLEFELFWLPQ